MFLNLLQNPASQLLTTWKTLRTCISATKTLKPATFPAGWSPEAFLSYFRLLAHALVGDIEFLEYVECPRALASSRLFRVSPNLDNLEMVLKGT